MIEHRVMDSAAWQSLGAVATRLLIQMARRYNGANNGSIAYSVREASTETGAAVNTVRAAFVELEARGFIECVERGHFQIKVRVATIWRLTFYATAYKPASHDYLGWSPK